MNIISEVKNPIERPMKKKTNKEICNIEEKWTVAKESNTNRVFVTNYHAHAIANLLYGVLALFSIFFNTYNDWTHIETYSYEQNKKKIEFINK